MALAALFLLMTAEFCLASRNQSALVPRIFLLPLQTPWPPLSVLSPPAGDSLWIASSDLISFWISVGVSQWETQHETGRREESGVDYLSPCLAPYKVILGVLSTFSLFSLSLSLSPCPMGPGGPPSFSLVLVYFPMKVSKHGCWAWELRHAAF